MILTNEEAKVLNDKIESEDLKATYLYLVYFSQKLKGVEAKQYDMKPKLSFRYFDGEGKYPFSFIVNQNDILLCIRSKAMHHFGSEFIEQKFIQYGFHHEDKSKNLDTFWYEGDEMRVRIRYLKSLAPIKDLLSNYNW